MGFRRRRRRHRREEWLSLVIIAFGAGLLLALFCSVKLALIACAIALIYLGITYRPC